MLGDICIWEKIFLFYFIFNYLNMEKKFLKFSSYFILFHFYFLRFFFHLNDFLYQQNGPLIKTKKQFFCERKSIKHASSSKFHELGHPFFFRYIVFRALVKKISWLVSMGPKMICNAVQSWALYYGLPHLLLFQTGGEFHFQNTSYSLDYKDFHFVTSTMNKFIGNFYLVLLFTSFKLLQKNNSTCPFKFQ